MQKEKTMGRNTNYKNSKPREAKLPSFIAYHVAEKSESKSFWTRIGSGLRSRGRQGFHPLAITRVRGAKTEERPSTS